MYSTWPALTDCNVQIWFAQLDQLARHETQAWQSLSADERTRAKRFHFEQHRQRFLASHFFLRLLLAAYLDQAVDQIHFTYGEHGKPALPDTPGGLDLRFNMAHSSNLAVVGLALGQDLGVDIERLNPLRDVQQIAHRFFSAPEQAEFDQLPSSETLTGFYHCWTRKEAFIKALGDGLAFPLADFDVTLTPDRPARLLRVGRNPDEALCWSLVSFQPVPGYVAALAIRRPGAEVAIHEYSGERVNKAI